MDIYFQTVYGKLNELIESGRCVSYDFDSESGSVHHMFICREIPFLIDGEQYYDIITPYGYGGPLIVNANEGKKQELCKEFGAAFAAYCERERIISEFVRFHPVMNNAVDFQDIYHPIYMRKTLGTNLSDYDDPVQSEFSKSCRKNIRKALNNGVSYRVTEAPDSIDGFYDIYRSTMKRDHASKFYFIDRKYFDNLINLIRDNVLFIEALYEEKTIAAGLFLLSDGVIHVHLSGTLSDYLYLSPAYILRYAAALWGKEHGYRLIHHGGGTSNSEDNSLYLFKKQFSVNTAFEFYVGKKIWNKEVYDAAVRISGNEHGDFFPQYRKLDE